MIFHVKKYSLLLQVHDGFGRTPLALELDVETAEIKLAVLFSGIHARSNENHIFDIRNLCRVDAGLDGTLCGRLGQTVAGVVRLGNIDIDDAGCGIGIIPSGDFLGIGYAVSIGVNIGFRRTCARTGAYHKSQQRDTQKLRKSFHDSLHRLLLRTCEYIINFFILLKSGRKETVLQPFTAGAERTGRSVKQGDYDGGVTLLQREFVEEKAIMKGKRDRKKRRVIGDKTRE